MKCKCGKVLCQGESIYDDGSPNGLICVDCSKIKVELQEKVQLKIVKKEKESGKNVVERLKEALAMAEDGLIEDIFIVATQTNGKVSHSWANGGEPFLMLGKIEEAKYDYMKSNIEQKE